MSVRWRRSGARRVRKKERRIEREGKMDEGGVEKERRKMTKKKKSNKKEDRRLEGGRRENSIREKWDSKFKRGKKEGMRGWGEYGEIQGRNRQEGRKSMGHRAAQSSPIP